ncbi:hypothetical protein [Actinokineospora diospyrosa]|uniref:Uncharacterized protein n=1 Tax=Actinokineospora diospyrosa TaxID=103728 RepID=A0ABT1I6T3_9PSEU|nr:hypothetical protein [Actinokineospora diospyrosa]
MRGESAGPAAPPRAVAAPAAGVDETTTVTPAEVVAAAVDEPTQVTPGPVITGSDPATGVAGSAALRSDDPVPPRRSGAVRRSSGCR